MSKRDAHILVVDDDKEMVRILSRSLTAHGYTVSSAYTGEGAIKEMFQHHPDLLLLDLLLPDMSGLEVCRQIRSKSSVPILVLSVKEREHDKVEALDLGADDYIQKPFSMGELLARIRVALRRVAQMQTGTEQHIQLGPLRVDFAQRLVQLNGRTVELTPIEYAMLSVLLAYPGKILTRQMLLQAVWSAEEETSIHTLHVHVAHLRQKIEPDPHHPRFILTIPGVGYRLNDEIAEG